MEFVKLMETWISSSRRQTAALISQWATAGAAINFAIGATLQLQNSIPDRLAPSQFRTALQEAVDLLRGARSSLAASEPDLNVRQTPWYSNRERRSRGPKCTARWIAS